VSDGNIVSSLGGGLPFGPPVFECAPSSTVDDALSQTKMLDIAAASVTGPRLRAMDSKATRAPLAEIDGVIVGPSPYAPAGDREISLMSAAAVPAPSVATPAAASSTAIAVLGPARILPPPSSVPGRATVLAGRSAHKRRAA